MRFLDAGRATFTYLSDGGETALGRTACFGAGTAVTRQIVETVFVEEGDAALATWVVQTSHPGRPIGGLLSERGIAFRLPWGVEPEARVASPVRLRSAAPAPRTAPGLASAA